ncbi:dolichyl-phosphate-mannose-protein mannosyltransferase [Tamaricihabitans halophyticus]|uniref:Dolichyl-phosphate-mannose-protein mannosyltransferase n=1 Tax=Tamaricihabitans halophyticus TaxID=1262583 RepID=A0A4R2QTL5_9PSEU|nr:glycosyltransferase family 39 protein [Tamaricihabitans halophyticus]TCP52068.1 dolichyl-phosphate-mannose-protein mannosyltransferase [Tamaricihabitans halophyticus]
MSDLVTTATQGRPSSPRRPARAVAPFASWPVFSIAGLVLAAHLVISIGKEYWLDEAYMLALGRFHLDWGFADQPPVVPLLAAAMDAVAPDSLFVLRLPAVLATVAAVPVAALIARELGADRRAQVFTALAQACALWITLSGHWLTPYTLEPLQWLLLVWLLVRWIRLRDDRQLLILGVTIGIAAQTKFQVLLLCAVLLVSVLLFGPRELLRRPKFWVGVGIALLIALPTLVWQAIHGWPQLRMSEVVAAEADVLSGGRSGVAFQLFGYAGIAGLVLLLYGLWLLFTDQRLRAYRFLGVTFVVLYVIFVVGAGRPYYLGGLYAVGFAVGALGLQWRREAGRARLRWLAWPAFGLSVAAAIGMLVLSTVFTSSPGMPVGERIAANTSTVYAELPARQRERTALLGESYVVASYLDAYASRYELPGSYSAHRGYGFFGPPPERVDAVVYVGDRPDRLRRYFGDVRAATDPGQDPKVWLATDRTVSWARIWPELREL